MVSQTLTELNRSIGEYVEALEQAGLKPAVVSGGSTPTVWHTHELAHLTELNHGPRFWAEVERLLPDFRDARDRIKEEELALLPL